MRNVYSVRQVNSYIKNMFTQDFMLNRIYVKGEVSNCKYHASGHIYFSLKDESGSMSCVMFAGQRSGLAFQMRDGQQVIALGNITTYERDGTYQLYAKEVILDGAGFLYEKFEALKRELGEMGMFAVEYKQAIPRFAKRIGIVTASTGAAIRDIMNVATRRNPYVQLVLHPALVQGDGAAASIAKGIALLDEQNLDVIIVGRGGGSIEDLWAFNEEEVARAIFHCRTPIISAVGHETDTTIADYVADMRAPTPSAAAELAVFEYQGFLHNMEERRSRMRRAMLMYIQRERMRIERVSWKMNQVHPKNQLLRQQQRSLEFEQRLERVIQARLQSERQRLAIYMERMKGISPIQKLNQGFSYVATPQGAVVKRVEDVNPKDRLRIHVTNGVIEVQVQEAHKEEYCGRADTGTSI